jgi:hypothetical protein
MLGKRLTGRTGASPPHDDVLRTADKRARPTTRNEDEGHEARYVGLLETENIAESSTREAWPRSRGVGYPGPSPGVERFVPLRQSICDLQTNLNRDILYAQ